jgi:hypothetical protein
MPVIVRQTATTPELPTQFPPACSIVRGGGIGGQSGLCPAGNRPAGPSAAGPRLGFGVLDSQEHVLGARLMQGLGRRVGWFADRFRYMETHTRAVLDKDAGQSTIAPRSSRAHDATWCCRVLTVAVRSRADGGGALARPVQ